MRRKVQASPSIFRVPLLYLLQAARWRSFYDTEYNW